MIHHNRLIFQHVARCWLAVFSALAIGAGLARASDEAGVVELAVLEKGSDYSTAASSRKPVRAFATDSGVYALDSQKNAVRIWQRGAPGVQLMAEKSASGVFSSANANSGYLFTGKIAGGAGVPFREVRGLALDPQGGAMAVLSAGAWNGTGLNKYCPSVQVYGFGETVDASGRLSSVAITNVVSYDKALYETVASVSTELESIESVYTLTETTVTNFVTTNYVYVVETEPELKTEVVPTLVNDYDLLDHDPQSGYVVGTCWIQETPDVTKKQSITYSEVTNYVTHFTYETNSYLSAGTDVAFLGDAGLVVSLAGSEQVAGVSGLLVFDLSDPSADALVFPVTGLGGEISGIDVDHATGDIYAAVPSRGAVYRISSPGGTVSSWLGAAAGTAIGEDDGTGAAPAWSVAAGEPGVSSAEFSYLARPSDVSVWTPASAGETLLLVPDAVADGRVAAFDLSSNAVFYAKLALGDPLKRPSGVFGIDGEDNIVVADTDNGRTLLAKVDFSEVESSEILAVESSAIDGSFSFPESDAVSNVVSFAVAQSRSDRTYRVSVASDPDGAVELCSATAVVPADETTGSFAFFGRDGGTNALETAVGKTGSTGCVFRVELATDPSCAVEVPVEVQNVSPAITNAMAICHLDRVVTISPAIIGTEYEDMLMSYLAIDPDLTGIDPESDEGKALAKYVKVAEAYSIDAFRVRGKDVAADMPLRYYWWATTNVTWAMNNLYWAVSNAEDAVWASAGADAWTEVPAFEAAQNATEGAGTEEVALFVAKGRQVARPAGANGFVAEFPAEYPATTDAYGYGMVVVATVIDKDGGASVITWPFGKAVTGQYRWVPTLDADPGPDDPSGGGGGSGGGGEEPAVYSAVFTAISPTAVSFRVKHESGTPAQTDTVSLHSSSDLSSPQAGWPVAGNASPSVFNVGADVISDGQPEHDYQAQITPSGDSAFYTIQNP